jgi:hypothetical protein
MTAIMASATAGARESLRTTVERPALVPLTPAARWRRG